MVNLRTLGTGIAIGLGALVSNGSCTDDVHPLFGNQKPKVTILDSTGNPIETAHDAAYAKQQGWNDAIVLPVFQQDIQDGLEGFIVQGTDYDGPGPLKGTIHAVNDNNYSISFKSGNMTSDTLTWKTSLVANGVVPRGQYPGVIVGLSDELYSDQKTGIVLSVIPGSRNTGGGSDNGNNNNNDTPINYDGVMVRLTDANGTPLNGVHPTQVGQLPVAARLYVPENVANALEAQGRTIPTIDVSANEYTGVGDCVTATFGSQVYLGTWNGHRMYERAGDVNVACTDNDENLKASATFGDQTIHAPSVLIDSTE